MKEQNNTIHYIVILMGIFTVVYIIYRTYQLTN